MKVDKYTVIFPMEGKNYIVNLKTNAIDIASDYIQSQVKKLRKTGSFTIKESGMSESIIEYLIERGHFNIYSNIENKIEKSNIINRKKEKLKQQEKTASILIDSLVGNKWCFTDETIENRSLTKDKIIGILRHIKSNRLSKKVNIWILPKGFLANYEWLLKVIKENTLIIGEIYTLIKENKDMRKLESLAKSKDFPALLKINIKKEGQPYIALVKTESGEILKADVLPFLENYPYFCPFIYKTFFISGDYSIDYCVKQLSTGINTPPNYTEDESYNNLCGKDIAESCPFNIICGNSCEYLEYLYKNNNKDSKECGVATFIKNILLIKLQKHHGMGESNVFARLYRTNK